MDTESKAFWSKYSSFNKKTYENNGNYFEFLASLIITKFNLDAYRTFSKFTNFFVDDSLRFINKTLSKSPEIWQFFEDSQYKECLNDKSKRKLYLYKVLNKLK